MHFPKKRLGQHFLIDHNAIDSIVQQLAIMPRDALIEIGPGTGALTNSLPYCAHLHLIERDADLLPYLRSTHPNAIIWHANATKFNFLRLLQQLLDTCPRVHVIGNLPYNVSSQILIHLITQLTQLTTPQRVTLFFMLQKEMVERITAASGTRQYGRLSVIVQLHAQAIAANCIPPSAFEPQPKIESQLIHLLPYRSAANTTTNIGNKEFNTFIQRAFQYKRKTLKNNLQKYYTLKKVSFDYTRRAESCSPSELTKLFIALTTDTTE